MRALGPQTFPMSAQTTGIVASLHIHPSKGGLPLVAVEELHLEEGKGIAEDRRYFNRNSRRQVTLMEREQIQEHADAFGLGELAPGVVRSNIETTGIDLVSLLGREVEVGGALVRFYEPRKPCAKMDAICQGLKERMEPNKQGVLAIVVRSGVVRPGDTGRSM